jgi:hypothetical protein
MQALAVHPARDMRQDRDDTGRFEATGLSFPKVVFSAKR